MERRKKAQRVRCAPPIGPVTASHRTPFCACYSEAQRVRCAPPIGPVTASHHAPFCACYSEVGRANSAAPTTPGSQKSLRLNRPVDHGRTPAVTPLSSALDARKRFSRSLRSCYRRGRERTWQGEHGSSKPHPKWVLPKIQRKLLKLQCGRLPVISSSGVAGARSGVFRFEMG